MNAPLQTDWTDANQRLLVAEFARLKALLGDGDASPAGGADLETARAALSGPAAIDALARIFTLSGFEREVLLLAAGVEMDAKLAALCGEALGWPQHPWATVGLALAVLPGPHWSALTPAGPLRLWRLIEVDESAGLASARLKIDERILHYLAGINYLDARLRPLLRPVNPPHLMAPGQERVAEEVARYVEGEAGASPIIQLSGDDPHGQEDVAARAAEKLGSELHAIAAGNLPTSPHELDDLSVLLQRETALSGDALLIDQTEGASREVLQRFVERIGSPVFVASREPVRFKGVVLRFTVDKPDAPEQRQLWRALLGASAERLGGALDGIAGQYRLSARAIEAAAARIISLPSDAESPALALWEACRGAEVAGLGALARRIEPMASWDDLILPEAQKSTLRRIAAHVRHRLRVYHDWGFAAKSTRGLGISALFTGESGTGKTMAAEVLARELNLELYRIDLSAVVSKYIGETEKNLRRVFDAAEASGAILLFDEADALFGKRSEVKDSHDRYANIEVSYLLQRMEAYRGLAILTTNLKAALDTAFQRRLRFIVQFPFPDTAQREAIWRGIFPADTPVDGIDCTKLARLNVTGGSIRNIALSAAFLAAEAGMGVGMGLLLQAARSEAAKRERSLTDSETRGWV